MAIYWLDPVNQLSATSAADPSVDLSIFVAAIGLQSTFVRDTDDTYWTAGAPPLRMIQRDDGLGHVRANGPRLPYGRNAPSSTQGSKSRLPGREGQAYR